MGLDAQDTAELFFEDVRVPVDCLLQAEGKGMHMLMGDLPYERLLIALCGVAAMEGALEETIRYVNERKIFGHPVASFQNTKFKLAECVTHTRVARVFVDRCVELLVRGELDTETAAMAKWWVTDMQQKVIDECQQLLRRLRLHERIPRLPHVRGLPRAAHLRRHQRGHEGTDLPRPLTPRLRQLRSDRAEVR